MNELRQALELADEDELQALTDVLFCRRFNPLDYVSIPKPTEVQRLDRLAHLDVLEQRFRHLAADGFTVLRGQTDQVTYRDTLMRVCDRLDIQHRDTFSTAELEAEMFLGLLNQTWKHLPESEQKILATQINRTISQSELAQQLPIDLRKNPVSLVFKGGSALAMSSVLRPWLLQEIARQFLRHLATYQLAQKTLVQGGALLSTQLQSRFALSTASRGMALNAARYGAARSLFALLGPLLWASFFADLGWRAIATSYGRIIPALFTVAQIRLTRAEYLECL